MHRTPFTRVGLACLALSGWAATSQAADAFAVDSPWMTGDWNGQRTALLQRGVDIRMGYTGETSTLLKGGYAHKDRGATRYADQFNLGVDLDLQKLWGWEDAAASVSLTNRNGADNLNEMISAPGVRGFGSTQEIQGRGSVTRLSELWLSKGWLDDRVNLKAGRFAVSDDFAVEDCLFQGLAFCGSQPGNYVDSIYNGPISQWAARLRYRLTPELYAQIAAFNVNPSNLDHDSGLKLNESGSSGTLLPVELVWAPRVHALPGEYRLGGYRSSANADNLYYDANGESAALTGNAYRRNGERHGWWIVGKQQLTTVAGDASRGLTLMASATFQDHATTPVSSYQKVSLVYKGPFDARPTDTLGLGIARVHGSSLLLRNAETANAASGAQYGDADYVPEQHDQYQAELNYGIQATRWLNVMPSVQYVKDPDGVRQVRDALVFGLQVQSQF